MARKSTAAAVSAKPAIPSIDERMEQIRVAEQRANEARIRRTAERDVAAMKNEAALAKVRVADPRDIQSILSALPYGARWAARLDSYWAKGPIDLRGKRGLYLNFGGATVDYGGSAEFPFLLDDDDNIRIFNAKGVGLYVPPPPVEEDPEPEPVDDELEVA